ncbi:hypothetical protein CIG11343_0639 [Campylobacter iguaniorum]|nr:hypothetical protein [Campylobacter iguaniorum]ANE35694.1 hypothetical protein CIG11343_0639 [Campylobacter iguaniorum]
MTINNTLLGMLCFFFMLFGFITCVVIAFDMAKMFLHIVSDWISVFLSSR